MKRSWKQRIQDIKPYQLKMIQRIRFDEDRGNGEQGWRREC